MNCCGSVRACCQLRATPTLPTHNYLHDLYSQIHDTPMQRKLRHLAPTPAGVVFLPWPGMTEADA